jgi:ATP-dependent DNA helicase DinG
MLYHPERDRGLLKRLGGPRDREAVGEALVSAERFFNDLRGGPLRESQLFRVRDGETIGAELAGPLNKVCQAVESVIARTPDESRQEELKDAQRRIDSWRTGLVQFCSGPEAGQVHWLEKSGRRQDTVTLRTAPLDVAAELRGLLFGVRTSVIVTSATLAAGSDVEDFASRIGADGARCELLQSPFDFDRQMVVNIAEDTPDPAASEGGPYYDWLRETLAFCVQRSTGGTLVLFTSYRDIQHCVDRLQSEAEALERDFFVQGGTVSRNEMVRRFRAAGNGILLGTDTFWTGIDVPGRALSHVVLVRLPFEHPSHPVAEARSEWVRARGGVPFTELVLPASLRMFRQGVGRLIRSAEDCGTVTILDNRILTKPYSRNFLGCLPVRRFQRFNRGNRDARFAVL